MTSKKAKRGRKTIPHRTADGKHIDGLYRLPDGRWRITLDGPYKGHRFSEPDEKLAVAHFYRLTQANHTIHISIPLAEALPHHNLPAGQPQTPEALAEAAKAAFDAAGDAPATTVVDLDVPPGDWTMEIEAHEPLIWAWVRQQIMERPRYVAQQVGIEEIGWLDQLPKPTPLPTLDEVGKFYHDRAQITEDWRDKSKGHVGRVL